MAVSVFFYEYSYDACYWYFVGYILKASQVVPTSEPMNMFISGISIARHTASSPAVVAFGTGEVTFPMMIVMPSIRISFPGCADFCANERDVFG